MIATRIIGLSTLLAFAASASANCNGPVIMHPEGNAAWTRGVQEKVTWATGMMPIGINYTCGQSTLQIFGQGKLVELARGFSILQAELDVRPPDLPWGLYQLNLTCGECTGKSQPFYVTRNE